MRHADNTLNTDQVVYDVGEGPHHRHAEEGDAQQHDVKDPDAERIRQPDPPTVHDPGVGVHLTVCHTYVHSGLEAATHTHTHDSTYISRQCIYLPDSFSFKV